LFCDDCGQRLALKSDGTIWAWGNTGIDELDDAATRTGPVQVAGLANVTAIAAGSTHALAVTADGSVWAWGSNASGQLGEPASSLPRLPEPIPPPGSPDLAIAATHTGDFVVGKQGIYNLTIANPGAASASGTVTVTDILPPGLAFLSAAGSGFTCAASGQTVSCTHPGPVEPDDSMKIAIAVNVRPDAVPGVTNMATVSNDNDRNACNNAAADPTVVLPGR
jgi:uncharacterized repeat protein (TIGR01451 family)